MSELVAADGPLLEQILDATYDLWHEGLSRSAYRQYFAAQRLTPWGRTRLRRLALVESGQVLASAKLYDLDAVFDGRPLRIAGIGAVFTQPRHRGRGFAHQLLNRVLEETAAGGADAALLFSEIGPDLYARLGFQPIATYDLTLKVLESRRRGAPAAMVRAGEERDLSDLAAMDARRGEPFRWHLRRDRDFVHYALVKKRLLAGLDVTGAREVQFFVAEEGASAVAYIVVSARTGERSIWTIESCGDRDPSGSRLGAVLQALIARDPTAKRPSITAWLPSRFCPPQVAIVDRVPSRDIMMWRSFRSELPSIASLRTDDIFYWRGDVF